MYYSIRHLTKFRYSAPINESLMEVRMHPRSDGFQRCLSFELSVSPRARILNYRDYMGNQVHHFNIPGRHNQLAIKTEALVEMLPPAEIPESLDGDGWQRLEELTMSNDAWDMLLPSSFTERSALLEQFERELNLQQRADPLSLLREINKGIHNAFDYKPQSTKVDSKIDEALEKRQGVCQDFAHIMIALVRHLGIPCRYVSGYLFHRTDTPDRSAQDATHAWVEALLPDLGWVGFDPTNNLLAGERHIRTAIGRDYTDVPPTRGVFKGEAETELKVAVQVSPTTHQLPETEATRMPSWTLYEASQQQQ
ncbi:MAG: transglutaminase family protein [Acidobacteriota bacterium]